MFLLFPLFLPPCRPEAHQPHVSGVPCVSNQAEINANIRPGPDRQHWVSANWFWAVCCVPPIFHACVQGHDTRSNTRPADNLPVGGPAQPQQPGLGDGYPADQRVAAIRQRAGLGPEQQQEDQQDQQNNQQALMNHQSGLGQMLNPQSTCFVSSGVHLLVASEVDLHLDPQVLRTPDETNLDQVSTGLSPDYLNVCCTGRGAAVWRQEEPGPASSLPSTAPPGCQQDDGQQVQRSPARVCRLFPGECP